MYHLIYKYFDMQFVEAGFHALRVYYIHFARRYQRCDHKSSLGCQHKDKNSGT